MQKFIGKRVIAIALAAVVAVTALSADTGIAATKVSSVAVTAPAVGTLCMKKGTTFKLKVKVLPAKASNKKVKYASNKKKVAKVNSNGKIKAVGIGTAKITVKSKDRSGKKATVSVKVVKKFTKVSKITLSQSSVTLYTNGTDAEKTASLSAKLTPSKPSVKSVKYVSADNSVAKVSNNGVITAVSAGTTIVSAYAADGRGAKATCSVKVTTKGQDTKVNPANQPLQTNKPSAKPYQPTAKPTNDNKIHTITSTVTKTTRAEVKAGTSNVSFKVDDNAKNVLDDIDGSVLTLGIYAHNVKPTYTISSLKLKTASDSYDVSLTEDAAGAVGGKASFNDGKISFSSSHNYYGMLTIACSLPSGVKASDITGIDYTVDNTEALSLRLYAGGNTVSQKAEYELTSAQTSMKIQ